MLRLIVVLVSIVAFTGCSTMRSINVTASPNALEDVRVGDQVLIRTKAGQSFDLKLTAIGEDALTGRDETGKLWKVPVAQIEDMSVKRISPAKTGGAALVGIGLVAVVLFIIGAHALGKALESGPKSD